MRCSIYAFGTEEETQHPRGLNRVRFSGQEDAIAMIERQTEGLYRHRSMCTWSKSPRRMRKAPKPGDLELFPVVDIRQRLTAVPTCTHQQKSADIANHVRSS